MIEKTQKPFLHVLVYLLFLVLLPAAARAVSVTEYRSNIHQINRLLSSVSFEENLSNAENIANQQEIFKQIRAKLPPTEKVELQAGTPFEINNQPLLEKLKEIEGEAYDSPKRRGMINEVSENLSALEKKLQELESQSLSKLTKDEEKQKLAEILRREEYRKPEVKESLLQKLWREFWEWFFSMFPEPKTGPNRMGDFQGFSNFLVAIVLVLVLGGLGFLIYKFAPALMTRFNVRREKPDKKSRVILGETLGEDETSQNLFSEAERLAREGNLRAAVRKGYIALLCELSDRKIIGLARHKTNRDYLRDVRSRKKLFQNMDTLTGSFERHWYGFEPPEQQDWDEFRSKYKQTVTEEAIK